MARNDKVNMPHSTAGITRYFDEFKGKFSIKPHTVVAIIIIVIIVILAIRYLFAGWVAS